MPREQALSRISRGRGLGRFGALMALLVAGFVLQACDGEEKQKGQAGAKPPQSVGVVVVHPETVMLSERLPGRVVAFRKAEVRPQVDGVVEKRLFEEGALVEAGQHLYQIEAKSYRAALKAAQAELARARATHALDQKKLKRYEKLVQTQTASRQAYDDIVAAAEESKAAVAVARAEMDVAAINVEYTKVNAPIPGLIGRSQVSEGALVTASQATVMTTITQLDPIYVDLTQSSSKLIAARQKIASGAWKNVTDAPVVLVLDGAGKTYPHEGRLKLSEVVVDEGTDSVTLRAEFPNPDKVLLPGMFVRAEVSQGRVEDGFLIPQRAVQRAPNGDAFVWIVKDDNTVGRRSLTLSGTVGQDWLVQAGMKDGDKVIVEGLLKVRAGAAVAPQIVGGDKAEAAAKKNP